jgi:hypothetical protein
MRSIASSLAVTAALALGACGASAPQTPTSAIRALMSQWINDVQSRQFGAACDLMTEEGRASVGNGDPSQCGPRLLLAVSIVGQAAITDELRKAATGPITVSGTHATKPNADGSTSTFEYQSGRWLLGPDRPK